MPPPVSTTSPSPSAGPPIPAGGPTRFPGSPRLHRWLRLILIVIVFCLALDLGFSLLLEYGWLHRSLTRRLTAAFGRPVEVLHYSFSLLEGPRLEADYITVGEDPRFGNEYFLRADQLAIGLRWSALLRGRIEFGPLSFDRPSLNLVRLPDGEWNLESWLPRPAGNLPAAPASGRVAFRLQRIDVSDGRVDFKQGPDKLPFAFANVQGSVEQIAHGSWRLALQAQPFRAAVVMQQAGVLSLTGLVGGTSSRLRPASFELNWEGASLSDVLRLLRGTDYGVRGLFSLQLAAQTVGYDWTFSSRAQFRQLHRWDLPLRPDDPAANLNVTARWAPDKSRFDLTQAVLEMPRSHIHATGSVDWTPAPNFMQPTVKNAQLQIFSDGVEMSDALTWYRAFHSGVADQLGVRGITTMNLALSGWPPRIQQGIATLHDFELAGGSRPVPIRMRRASLLFSDNSVSLLPAKFSIGVDSGEFRLRGSAARLAKWRSAWALDGQTTAVRALFGAASALGFSLPPGWLIDGPAQFHLQFQGAHFSMIRQPQGTIALAGVRIRAPFLNREINHVAAAVNFSPGDVKIRLDSADAFAANWHGTLERNTAPGGWEFALSANQLNAAEMDRWLNPQRRQSLLDRLLPFLASKPQPQPIPSWLRGRGSVSFGEFALAPLRLTQLSADASVDGRKLALSNARAAFYRGKLRGSIALNLAAQPTYDATAQFSGVNLSLLAARTFSLADLFAGAASGDLQISAKGIGRAALLQSLACRGDARIRNAEYKGIDLGESVRAGVRRSGTTGFPAASTDFSCAAGQIRFSRLHLESPGASYKASGFVDAKRQMNFEFHPLANDAETDSVSPNVAANDPANVSAVSAANARVPANADTRTPGKDGPAASSRSFELTGPLKSPKFTRTVPAPPSH
ncbi:MAG TPA: AsmA family protein [Candidatus Acidoferrales bacterium]|nr:AsmA family protein [Candidatus Acidoferrales bacterium]